MICRLVLVRGILKLQSIGLACVSVKGDGWRRFMIEMALTRSSSACKDKPEIAMFPDPLCCLVARLSLTALGGSDPEYKYDQTYSLFCLSFPTSIASSTTSLCWSYERSIDFSYRLLRTKVGPYRLDHQDRLVKLELRSNL